MSFVIGLVGEKGGGKGAFTEILKEVSCDSITHLRSSDVLLDMAKTLGIPKEKVRREQLQELAKKLEEVFGKGCISRAMRARILQAKSNMVIFDGVRWDSDVKMIRSLPKGKYKAILVYVTADARIRFMRAKKRNEKSGESEMEFEQFMREEKAKTEKYIPELGKMADVTIRNNGTLEEFRQKVEEFYIFKTR